MTSPRSLTSIPLAARAALLLALLGVPAHGAAAPPDLVVAADPTASDALAPGAPDGPVSLVYRVAEVFSGEPSGSSLVVRHDALSEEDRARLRDGERVILLANPDPEAPGRYVAGAPLRATPSALSAFRKWSAPEDVRAGRPVEDVVLEVKRTAATAAPGSRAEADDEPESEPVAQPAPPRAQPATVAALPPIDDEILTARGEPAVAPVVAQDPVATVVASPVATSPAKPSPVTTEPSVEGLHPRSGPGLPPVPARVALGPGLEQREDLRPPPRGRQER